MSELALVVWTLFSATLGGLLSWMWMQLRYQDQRAELEEAYAKYAEWMARALAAETRVAWLSSYANRTYAELADVRQELEVERIVSESYAAGIARDER